MKHFLLAFTFLVCAASLKADNNTYREYRQAPAAQRCDCGCPLPCHCGCTEGRPCHCPR